MTSPSTSLLPAPSLPDWLALELPYERVLVETSLGRVHSIDDGDKRSPRAIVLMHGNPAWCFLWRKVIAALRKRGAKTRIVAPDLMGLGLSFKPTASAAHTVERHVRVIDETLAGLGVRDALLVGQDWGGPIGAGAMQALKARGGRVRGLLFANTSVLRVSRPIRTTSFHRFANMPIVADLMFRGVGFPIPVLHRVQGDHASIGRLEKRAYRWPLRRLRDRVAPLALARMVPSHERHASVPALESIGGWVEAYRGPVALVWGKKDPILGRTLARHARALSARFIVETEAGHFLQEEVPAELADAVLRLEALT